MYGFGGDEAVVGTVADMGQNAGVADPRPTFQEPKGLDGDAPPKPNMKVL